MVCWLLTDGPLYRLRTLWHVYIICINNKLFDSMFLFAILDYYFISNFKSQEASMDLNRSDIIIRCTMQETSQEAVVEERRSPTRTRIDCCTITLWTPSEDTMEKGTLTRSIDGASISVRYGDQRRKDIKDNWPTNATWTRSTGTDSVTWGDSRWRKSP